MKYTLRELLVVFSLISGLLAVIMSAGASGSCGRTLKRIHHLELSRDGSHLLVHVVSMRYEWPPRMNSYDYRATHEVLLLEIERGTSNEIQRRTFRGPYPFRTVGFSPDGDCVATAEFRHVQFWEKAGADCGEHVQFLNGDMFWNADLRKQVAIRDENTLRIQDAATGRVSFSWEYEALVRQAVFARNDELVAVQCGSGLELRDLITGNVVYEQELGDFRLCDLSPDGSTLLLCHGGKVVLEDVVTRRRTIVLDSSRLMSTVRFGSDGTQIVVAGEHGVKLFDFRRPSILGFVTLTQSSTVNAAFPPCGNLLFTSDINGDILVWDTDACQCLRRIRVPGRFGIPWTIPLVFFGVWLLAFVVGVRQLYTWRRYSQLLCSGNSS